MPDGPLRRRAVKPSGPRPALLLVTACDAGTANYLAPVLPRVALPWRAFVHREAAEIFAAQGLPCTVVERRGWDGLDAMGQAVVAGESYSALLAGTSWGPTLDKAVVRAARRTGLRSAGIVEHWSLYRERFSRVEDGVMTAPDEFLTDAIWVNDETARREAVAAGLPAGRIRAIGQPHLERQRERLAQHAAAQRGNAVVFVSEQLKRDFVANSPLDPGFDEFTALDGVIAALPPGAELVVKLHPQETADKYAFLAERGVKAKIVGNADAGALVASAGRVVGMMSMLLLEAALVRVDVISFMPGGRPADFIGNRIGATRPATSAAELRALLAAPSGTGPAEDFGRRFAGSADRVLAALTEFACV